MGLNIVIVGGGSSLGAALTRKLSQLNHNIIVITGKHQHELQKIENVEYFYSPLKNTQDVTASVETVREKFSTVDVIFYNIGGGLGMHDPFLSYEDLNTLLWFNFGVIQEMNRLMLPEVNKGGKIICVGSIATRQIMGSLGYTLSKTSLETYVKFMGQELIKKDISIMAISIGAYWEKGNAMDRLKSNQPKIFNDFLTNRLPRKKMATSEDIIPFLTTLCLNDSSIFSGAVIPMDGAESQAL
ncbi:SDR family oxidoreductase [Paracoccaceae bacterium]|nr:SDR family oxidoreductase [Paracoccaceae bacterium]